MQKIKNSLKIQLKLTFWFEIDIFLRTGFEIGDFGLNGLMQQKFNAWNRFLKKKNVYS